MSHEIFVRPEPRLHRAVKLLAYAQGKSINRMVCELLQEACQQLPEAADVLAGRDDPLSDYGGFAPKRP